MPNDNPGKGEESDAINASEGVWFYILGVEKLDSVGVDGEALEYLK